MSRYVITGTWDESISYDEAGSTITIETADLRDTRSGAVYTQGAYRVRIKSTVEGAPRTKTFKGETAWSASERYAEDARWFFRRQAR